VIINILKTVLKLVEKSQFNMGELSVLFDGVLNPVAAKAQRKVVVPQGLDLDAWINDPPSESEDESVPAAQFDNSKAGSNIFAGESYYHGSSQDSPNYRKTTYVEPTAEELETRRKTRRESENMNPYYIKPTARNDASANAAAAASSPPPSLTAERPVQPSTSKGAFPASLQLSLSDQIYRQTKIDEENHRLKKKSKSDGTKKGKKSSKKSDKTGANDDDEEDLYPVIKVTRGGELPEGITESGNEDDDDKNNSKNKKIDPHRALNIDLDDNTPVPPPVQVSAPPPPPPPAATAQPTEKPKKSKKKTTTEKPKRERAQYKELLSPADDQTNKPEQEKPKKKKTKAKPTTTATTTNDTSLFDIMSDDINPTISSSNTEPAVFKQLAESEHLTIVNNHYLDFPFRHFSFNFSGIFNSSSIFINSIRCDFFIKKSNIIHSRSY